MKDLLVSTIPMHFRVGRDTEGWVKKSPKWAN